MTGDEFKESVEARLAQLLAAERQQALTPQSALMIERLTKLVLRAGKRSRPGLLKLTYDAYDGGGDALLVDIAVALELQHQFLLVHDDIMDNDTVRYDGPNMLGYYQQDYPPAETTIASSMALMAGNLLFTYANQAILNHPGLSADQKVAVLRIIQATNVSVHAGQQQDIVNVLALQPTIDESTLLTTDFLKTAVYSVQQPMLLAAELLQLPRGERLKIQAFARAFGILYQLVDDYSDYFVNDSSFDNHPKYRDFRQGKLTYPLLFALEHAPAKDAAYLRDRAGDKRLPDRSMQKVARLLTNCGARAASKAQIDTYYAKAVNGLAQLNVDRAATAAFMHLLASFQL